MATTNNLHHHSFPLVTGDSPHPSIALQRPTTCDVIQHSRYGAQSTSSQAKASACSFASASDLSSCDDELELDPELLIDRSRMRLARPLNLGETRGGVTSSPSMKLATQDRALVSFSPTLTSVDNERDNQELLLIGGALAFGHDAAVLPEFNVQVRPLGHVTARLALVFLLHLRD